MKNTFVRVEVLDKSMNAEFIVAVPARFCASITKTGRYYV